VLNIRTYILYIDQTFPNRYIGLAGPLAWPPISLNLNRMNFCLWGHVKTAVYRTKSRSIDELKQSITGARKAIPVEHRHNAFSEFEHRIRLIIADNGAHAEIY